MVVARIWVVPTPELFRPADNLRTRTGLNKNLGLSEDAGSPRPFQVRDHTASVEWPLTRIVPGLRAFDSWNVRRTLNGRCAIYCAGDRVGDLRVHKANCSADFSDNGPDNSPDAARKLRGHGLAAVTVAD